MHPELDAPLFESRGHVYFKLASQTFTQWGYVISNPKQSLAVFTDKVSALQYMSQAINTSGNARHQVSPEERILQEDMNSSLGTSTLVTID